MKPVYLKLSKPSGKLAADSSRFWGNPALPAGVKYPLYKDDDGEEYPYVFICQINLADLKHYCGDSTDLFPSYGLLLFFARIDYYLGDYDGVPGVGGYISDPEAVKVLFIDDCTDLREVVLVDEDDSPLSPEELEISFSLCHDYIKDDDHCLIAPPDHREWATWDPPYEDWLILLQVDSFDGPDFNLNFMDCGVLDFLISPDALKRADFTDVRAILLST